MQALGKALKLASWLALGPLLAGACATEAGSGSEGPPVLPRVRERAPRPPAPSGEVVLNPESAGAADKIDLLLMIDNSISMNDKQQILRSALPDLMSRFVNPICVDARGSEYPPPPAGSSACPEGQSRQFKPVEDIHVGIVSSSLGDGGANSSCPSQGFPLYAAERVDMAHLLGSLERSRADANAHGFLEWRAGSTNAGDFNRSFQQMVSDVGENGCGWEAQLESWYRFLVDPVPYQEIVRVQCPGSSSSGANCIQRATGPDNRFLLDEALLEQRDAFLRPDSLVVILMLSDENDCSMQVGSQNWVPFNTQDMRPMFKGSSLCAEDPNSKCCYSCPLGPPAGCPADPACSADAVYPNRLAPELDGQNLRCFDQKRRFGVDVLYPTQRYVNALVQSELCWSADDLSLEGCDREDIFPNPLYAGGRQPSQVFLAGIVGVPWQALEASGGESGTGRTPFDTRRFKTYDELTQDDVWAQVLGSPGVAWRERSGSRPEVAGTPAVPPLLAQMIESPFPRDGITAANAINGREYDTTQGSLIQSGEQPKVDDLQYACIFPLATPRDCAALDPNTDSCDCYDGVNDRPLCEQTPGESAPGTIQYWGKAYPGLRELEVLKGFGERTSNSIVASICALDVADADSPNYGYRPAMAAIVNRMTEQLPPPTAAARDEF